MLFNTESKKSGRVEVFRNIVPCWLVKISPVKALVRVLLDLEGGDLILRNISSIYI